jgi:hypothetical protein
MARISLEVIDPRHVVTVAWGWPDSSRCYAYSLSAVYDECDFLQDKKKILVIVCGGVGITLAQLQDWGTKNL